MSGLVALLDQKLHFDLRLPGFEFTDSIDEKSSKAESE